MTQCQLLGNMDLILQQFSQFLRTQCQLLGCVVRGDKGGYVTKVEGHGGVIRGSELALQEVVNTGQ